MSSGTLYHMALVRTNISENISPPSSGFFRVITIPQLCYRGTAVDSDDQ
jgi:hypothetical protein